MFSIPGVSVAPPGNDERVGGIAFKLALDDTPPIGGIGLKLKTKIFSFIFAQNSNFEPNFFFLQSIYRINGDEFRLDFE